MTGVYLDTSALGRILLGEPGSQAVQRSLADFDRRVSSELLLVELRRLGLRHRLVDVASELLQTVALAPIDPDLLERAATVLPASVAALDAIHLATALNFAEAGVVEALMTYDRQLAAGAREHGLRVVAPG